MSCTHQWVVAGDYQGNHYVCRDCGARGHVEIDVPSTVNDLHRARQAWDKSLAPATSMADRNGFRSDALGYLILYLENERHTAPPQPAPTRTLPLDLTHLRSLVSLRSAYATADYGTHLGEEVLALFEQINGR